MIDFSTKERNKKMFLNEIHKSLIGAAEGKYRSYRMGGPFRHI
ncbi:hypothetical protein bcere0001_23450 [Bacillus cereus m1293]|nr:hypothetical protein bcere0001_23450 [Bacillus cereus m1293]